MTRFLRHYLLAVQFFTRIPVTGKLAGWVGFSPAMLRESAAHFPGVGVLVGALVGGFAMLLFIALPDNMFTPLVVAVLTTVAGVLLTGAFHEDGLADVADGLGGSLERARALEIMKDSRVGAFGALALVLAVLCKVALLTLLGSIAPLVFCVAVFAAHVVSRTWPLCTIALLSHVGDVAGSKSKPLAEQITIASLCCGFFWCFLAFALAGLAQGAMHWIAISTWLGAGAVASALAWAWSARWFHRRLQGFTGDCLGATQQVCEIAFYLGLATALRLLPLPL